MAIITTLVVLKWGPFCDFKNWTYLFLILAADTPVRTGYLQHRKSKKCLQPKESIVDNGVQDGTPLVLQGGDCYQEISLFRLMSSGLVRHVASAKCLCPPNLVARPSVSDKVVFHSKCNSTICSFRYFPPGLLQHNLSSACLNLKDLTDPADNSEIYFKSDCANSNWRAFSFLGM